MTPTFNSEVPLKLTTICIECKKPVNVNVMIKDYDKWRAGTMIQDAFPYLTDTQRETIITGICPTCYDRIFEEGKPQ